MAHLIKSLSARSTLAKRRCHPSFSCVLQHRDERNESPRHHQVPLARMFNSSPAFGFSRNTINCANFAGIGFASSSFCRYMSTEVGGGAGGSENIEILNDVAEVLSDQTVTQSAAAVDEVAVAAADSFFPVKVLQYFIDSVHNFTGFEWWASIAVATFFIRAVTVPISIKQLKATSKLSLLRPRLEEIKQEMADKDMDPAAVFEGQKRMKSLFKEYGVSPFTPFTGLVVQGPVFISFFFAISNMVEKVPSFKSGGAYWFVDLTTPDNLYILPLLTALSVLVTVECNMQEGLEGNPLAKTMKKVSRVFAVATFPLTMGFPKAIFCYWITSNLFSLMYGTALKLPGVKKFLGVPELPGAPATTAPESSFNLFSALKQNAAVTQEATRSSSVEPSSKLSDKRVSSSAVISQRIRSLENQVKGRKKNKKI